MAAIFAGINTPYINLATLKRVLSNRQKDNIYQGIVTRQGEACTDKYSEDTNAAEIQIIRVKPNASQARTIGADTNGGFFNTDSASQPTTEAYGIKITHVIDNNIDIPANEQNMMNVDLLEAETKNLIGKVDRNVNAITIAAQFLKVLNTMRDDATNSTTNAHPFVEIGTAVGAHKDALLEANALLDDGNLDEGVDTYPRDQRAFLIRSSFNAELKKSGNLILDSNYGQTMVKTGALDADTKLEPVIGYVGTVDGVPCYVVSNPVWSLAEQYLGLTAGALNGVKALAVCGIGTGRALAFNDAIKMIDCPVGRGIRIQPLYRMGAECWDAKSVVCITDADYTNPATAELTLVAPASRA